MPGPLKIIWASPWSILGLLVGGLGICSGGRIRLVDGALECHGKGIAWLLRRAPFIDSAAAMTLGHVIIGRSAADLEFTRAHERVHVRQYERWGPLFVPAYLAASCYQACRGKHPYWDNPFEKEAYREAP